MLTPAVGGFDAAHMLLLIRAVVWFCATQLTLMTPSLFRLYNSQENM